MLSRNARILFFNSLILPLIMPTLFGGEKDNAVLMNNLQLLQNKAAETILDPSFHSSTADALEALGWLTLEERMDLLANKDIHGYDARLKDNLGLPRVGRNWGKHRTH